MQQYIDRRAVIIIQIKVGKRTMILMAFICVSIYLSIYRQVCGEHDWCDQCGDPDRALHPQPRPHHPRPLRSGRHRAPRQVVGDSASL